MKKFLSVSALGLLSFLIVGCGGNDTSKEKVDSTKTEASSEIKDSAKEKGTDTFKDNILTTKDYTIKITGHEYLEGYQDSTVLAITFDFTNHSQENVQAYSSFLYSFKVSQEFENTVEELNMGIIADHEKFTEETSQGVVDVKPNGTVHSVSNYEVKDPSKPVDISVKANMFSDKVLGEFKFDPAQ
ncbi:hypothetical protein A5821_000367 [Enterococcus sp. 7F3_DIV0205]|uniref:DUF5067 domain-containing protein n=1 Tax=Candidatus Enterococcus palustris TaxID=1834189 RepID=A0AAQ3Y6R3_9ENTE|nr:DUF5067 domain-containing protein [Enterococcus sp. 7F3_DIV0205]OTN84780.1 hypothetical protein A5821_000709 [Enterococcus sp. 7F3_DIV0205]